MKSIIKSSGLRRRAGSFLTVIAIILCLLSGCTLKESKAPELTPEEQEYQWFSELYDTASVYPLPYAVEERLCVTAADVGLNGFSPNGINGSSGLFDLTNETVLEANGIFNRLYPASTTKILTAYIVMTQGNLDDIVTVGESITALDPGSSVAGLAVGDSLTVRDLLYALMLPSGNDAAVVLADYVSGSQEAFVELMNQTAAALMCTGSHFSNPHGLQAEDHYTTAYDLYLIFQADLEFDIFKQILDSPTYTASITHADGTNQMVTWEATNYYFRGLAAPPTNVTVLGGKTGTTDEAGSCLILYAKDQSGREFISVIMNASNKQLLYDNMTLLLSSIPPNA